MACPERQGGNQHRVHFAQTPTHSYWAQQAVIMSLVCVEKIPHVYIYKVTNFV